jgi:hypothetical protein
LRLKINKTKLILTFFALPVLSVFLIAAACAGCRYNNTDYAPIKTPVEASITIAVDESTAKNQDEAKKQYKKMLPEPVVQNMPYYYIAVLNSVESSNEAASELDIKLPHLIEIINAADSSNIKLTLMFCPRWAEMFHENSSKLALLDDWEQNGHEISCYHRSIYIEGWDGYTDLPYDEALNIRREISDKNFAHEYAGNMNDFINKLKMINSDIKSGYVQAGENGYSHELLRSTDFVKKHNISEQIIYYTYPGHQDLTDGSVQNDVGDHDAGLNKFIISANKDGVYRKYLSHLHLSSKQDLDFAIKTSEEYDSSYVFGLVFLNDSNLLKYYFSILQYIQMLDPEGLNSKTITQIMEDKILQETPLASRQ